MGRIDWKKIGVQKYSTFKQLIKATTLMLQFIDKCRRCKKDMNDMPATRYEERSKELWFMYL